MAGRERQERPLENHDLIEEWHRLGDMNCGRNATKKTMLFGLSAVTAKACPMIRSGSSSGRLSLSANRSVADRCTPETDAEDKPDRRPPIHLENGESAVADVGE